jgi:hypothetical protein
VLEELEDRTTPTIVFTPNPAFRPETVQDGGGPKYGSNSPIFLVFKGSYWSSGAGAQQASDITSNVQSLASSAYFSGLTQYGSGGAAGGVYTVYDPGDWATGFTRDDVFNLIQSEIDNAPTYFPEPDSVGPPDVPLDRSEPVYFVVTAPTDAAGNQLYSDQGPGVKGYHQDAYDYDPLTDVDMIVGGWAGSYLQSPITGQVESPVDAATQVLSHEIAEAFSDPFPGGLSLPVIGTLVNGGITVTPGKGWPFPQPPNSLPEIGDFEPAGNYFYRVGGTEVQAYWSRADQGYIVPDGNADAFLLAPQWNVNNTFTGQSPLTINGDQNGTTNDFLLISTVTSGPDAGGVYVDLNGQFAQFAPGQISSITINPLTGTNTIYISDVPSNVPVTIDGTSGGTNTIHIDATGAGSPITVNANGTEVDTVNVSSPNGNLDQIQAPVTIKGNGSTTLTVDDRGNVQTGLYFPLTTNYAMNGNSLTRTATALDPIFNPPFLTVTNSFSYTGLASLTIDSQPVAPTPVTYQIDSTSGASAVIINANSTDAVTVGDPQTNIYSVQNLGGGLHGLAGLGGVGEPLSE